jgi:hypothetical protein
VSTATESRADCFEPLKQWLVNLFFLPRHNYL